jgi:hypothetical protein
MVLLIVYAFVLVSIAWSFLAFGVFRKLSCFSCYLLNLVDLCIVVLCIVDFMLISLLCFVCVRFLTGLFRFIDVIFWFQKCLT